MRKYLILILIVFIILFFLFGLFSPYNFFTAKWNVFKGKYEQVHFNNYILLLEQKNKVSHKYNIEIVNYEKDETFVEYYYPFVKIYNDEMLKSYRKYKGDSIYNLYINEMDSLGKNAGFTR